MRTKILYMGMLAILVIFIAGVLSFNNANILVPKEVTTFATNADIRIDLVAGDATYATTVPQDSSVYDAMIVLASSTAFRFEAAYYSGLGYFIREINGIQNANGTYWTLYINGAYSTIGASQYRLKAGDHIEWIYEKK